MEDLPKRIPAHASQPQESFEISKDLHEDVPEPGDAGLLLPPPTGEPVSTELPEAVAHKEAEEQAKLEALRLHGRDKKLGRQIFALAGDEDESVPVRRLPTIAVTPEYKHLSRAAAHEVHRNKHLAEAAETNAVTGLPNRRAYDAMLKNTIVEAEQGGEDDVAVAILDLDGFKAVNDTKGHIFGDQVLRDFGLELQEAVRENDIVVHFGGDEFAVVMPEYRREDYQILSKDELSQRMTERFRLAAERVTQKLGAKVGASVGIGIYEPGDTPDSLTDKADVLMYEDKIARKTAQEQPAAHKPRTRLRDKFHRRKKPLSDSQA